MMKRSKKQINLKPIKLWKPLFGSFVSSIPLLCSGQTKTLPPPLSLSFFLPFNSLEMEHLKNMKQQKIWWCLHILRVNSSIYKCCWLITHTHTHNVDQRNTFIIFIQRSTVCVGCLLFAWHCQFRISNVVFRLHFYMPHCLCVFHIFFFCLSSQFANGLALNQANQKDGQKRRSLHCIWIIYDEYTHLSFLRLAGFRLMVIPNKPIT